MKARPTPSVTETFMKVQDDVANVVAAFTGVKAQFITAGWSPEAAEAMTLEMFRQGAGK